MLPRWKLDLKGVRWRRGKWFRTTNLVLFTHALCRLSYSAGRETVARASAGRAPNVGYTLSLQPSLSTGTIQASASSRVGKPILT